MLRVLLILGCINVFCINANALLKPDIPLITGESNFRHTVAGPEFTEERERYRPIDPSLMLSGPDMEAVGIVREGTDTTHEYGDDYRRYEHGRPVLSGPRNRRHRHLASRSTRVSQGRSSQRNPDFIQYRAKRGDTLYGISRKFNVSIDDIRRVNRIEQDGTLYTGQRLRIPGKERSESNSASTTVRTHHRPRFRWPLTSILTIRRDSLDGVRPIGIIITGKPGARVQCSAQGTVKKIGRMRGYGQYIIVRHETSYLTVYANLARIFVQEGQRVPQGRTIGEIDYSDHSLHFQINKGGKAKNPLSLLPERS